MKLMLSALAEGTHFRRSMWLVGLSVTRNDETGALTLYHQRTPGGPRENLGGYALSPYDVFADDWTVAQ